MHKWSVLQEQKLEVALSINTHFHGTWTIAPLGLQFQLQVSWLSRGWYWCTTYCLHTSCWTWQRCSLWRCLVLPGTLRRDTAISPSSDSTDSSRYGRWDIRYLHCGRLCYTCSPSLILWAWPQVYLTFSQMLHVQCISDQLVATIGACWMHGLFKLDTRSHQHAV